MNCYVVLYKDINGTINVEGVYESKKDAQKEANTHFFESWFETRFFRPDTEKYKRKQRRISRWNQFITRLAGKLMR